MAKHGLAFDQRPPSQTAAIKLQQIEAPRAQVAGRPIHEGLEVRLTVAVAHDNLGIDDGRIRWQGEQALADRREAFGVVVALARVDRDLIARFVQLGTPAVELDLVQPLRPARRLPLQDGCGRDNERVTLEHGADLGLNGEAVKAFGCAGY
jgi:hypothetical protein